MQPSTGDILAMATYPDYNLNSPYEPNSTFASIWDSLSFEEKNDAWFKMWRNKAVADSYEPGSTFKIINAAIALEEGIVDTNTKYFLCTGHEEVGDRTVKCWISPGNHGYQSLTEALGNSCNPAFIQLGQKVGIPTFVKYYSAFGLFDKTSNNFAGEAKGIFYQDISKMNSVNLATMSFGQRFQITPIQLITAVSGIVNDGILMQPRIVKQIIDTNTGSITNIDPVEVRKIVSTSTSNKINSMLEYVVTDGTGSSVAISGYSIGGKTGTSQPIEGQEDTTGYVSSFIATAPANDPEVIILVTMYNPRGESHSGGTVAGSVVSNVLSKILPYLEIASSGDNSSEENTQNKSVPNVINKTLTEGQIALENAGFNTRVPSSENANNSVIVEQVPKANTNLPTGSIVALYTNKNTVRTSVCVPNVVGMTYAQAKNALLSKDLNIQSEGAGSKVIAQSVEYNEQVEIASVITVTLGD